MKTIAQAGQGILVYMRQEGRGIGLINKIKAYNLQDGGLDTVEANQHLGFDADLRDYRLCCEMLKQLNVTHIDLMTNNPNKIAELKAGGIVVSERIPHKAGQNPHNDFYLETKMRKLKHMA